MVLSKRGFKMSHPLVNKMLQVNPNAEDITWEDAMDWAVEYIEELEKWKEALIDEGVVTWSLIEGNANDPRQLLRDILSWHYLTALDPLVCKDAQNLRDTFREFAEYVTNHEPETKSGIKALEMLEVHKRIHE